MTDSLGVKWEKMLLFQFSTETAAYSDERDGQLLLLSETAEEEGEPHCSCLDQEESRTGTPSYDAGQSGGTDYNAHVSELRRKDHVWSLLQTA